MNKLFFIGLAIILLLANFVFAQPQAPDTMWTRTFGGGSEDYGQSVQQTSDGGYIIAGKTSSVSNGDYDVYLIKTDDLGNQQWYNHFGGISFEEAYSVQQTTDGGYIIAGATESFGAGSRDFYIIKTDYLGNTQWDTTYGGINSDGSDEIQQTSDGGYIICGTTHSFGTNIPVSNIYLIKTDALGNQQWYQTYGGDGYEDGYGVQQTTDGGYIICGRTTSYGAGNYDVYLIKTNSLGTQQWYNTFGGINYEGGCDVHQTIDGGFLITGATYPDSAGGQDVYLVKTDSLGNQQWINTFGGDSVDASDFVQQTADGGYIIAGWTTSYGAGGTDVYIIKTDGSGNLLWSRTLGGSGNESGHSVQKTNDGGFIVAGNTDSYGAGLTDVYLIKLAPENLSGPLSGTIGPGTYIVTGSISVDSGNSLIIQPGTTLKFNNNTEFDVNGYLYAVGTEEDSIKFIRNYPDSAWGGIDFNDSADDSSRLVYCLIAGSNDHGIFLFHSNPTIEKCIISGNTANDCGGGIYCSYSNSYILDCIINDNNLIGFLNNGAGIYCVNSSIIIKNCSFINNFLETDGAGLYCLDSSPVVDSCNFIGNTSVNYSGAGIRSTNSNFSISHCNFINNTSPHGSGIYCNSGNVSIEYSSFENNIANIKGAGICCDRANINIIHCIFNDNYAESGGAIMIFGVDYSYYANANFDFCTFFHNSAVSGSAIYIGNLVSSFSIINSILCNNYLGNAIYFSSNFNTPANNNDFYNNVNGDFGGLTIPNLGNICIVNLNGDSCDVYQNIFLDPLFQATTGDSAFRLTANSPCIDAGDPTSPYDPDNTIADIGAYYYYQEQLPSGNYGPAPDTMWTKTFGGSSNDYSFSCQQTSDGGFIMVGRTESFGGSFLDVYLVKADSLGNQLWYKTFGGIYDDVGLNIQQTSDGGFIIVGFTNSSGNGGLDVYLIKTDNLGNQIWSKTIGGSNNEWGYSVHQTSDEGFIIVGYTTSYGAGLTDVYLIKTNNAGDTLWTKTFGGISNDEGRSIQLTSDGGFIIAGKTESYGSGASDVYLIKTDSLGNEQWYKAFGGSLTEEGNSVRQTSDGGFIISGVTQSYGAGMYDFYLIRTDNQGNQQWFRTFGGSTNDVSYCVQQTSDGGFITVGNTSSFGAGYDDIYLIKIDSQGNQQWGRTYGGILGEAGNTVHQISDGGYIVSGYTTSYGAGFNDVYLIKLAPEELNNYVQISAQTTTATNQTLTDNNNFAGLDSSATDGYDAGIDIPEPTPPPNTYVSLYFPHPEWGAPVGVNFMEDVRKDTNLVNFVKHFGFQVNTDQNGREVDLTFSPGSGYPTNYGIVLYDSTTQTYQNLREDSTYNFTAGASPRAFDLRLGDGTAPDITINFPAPDTVLLADSIYVVICNLADMSHISYSGLYFSLNDGNSWTQIAILYEGANSFNWTVPDTTCYTARMKVTAEDWAGNIDSLISEQFTILPSTNPIVYITCPTPDTLLYCGITYIFSWTVSNNIYEITYQNLYYSLDDGLSWITSGLNVPGDIRTYWWLAPPGVYTCWAKFKVEAFDAVGQMGSDISDAFNVAPNFCAQNFAPYWNLLSIPLQPANNSTASVFGDDITGFYFVYTYAQMGGYSLVNSVYPGKGYWLCMGDTFTIDVAGEPEVDSLYLNLSEGWNIVGDALPTNVPKDSLWVKYDETFYPFYASACTNYVDYNLYKFNNSTGAYEDANTLEPWGGYWLKAKISNVQLITYPPYPGTVLDFVAQPPENDEQNWLALITLHQGNLTSNLSGLGMNLEATDGYDRLYDAITPPIPPSGIYLTATFEHPEWNAWVGDDFCRDVRAPLSNAIDEPQMKEWNFIIEASNTGQVTVNFADIDKILPSSYKAYAIFNGTSLNLRENHTFSFEYSQPLEVTVEVFNRAAVLLGWDNALANIELPTKYSIASIQPNPFNSTATIKIGLPAAGELKVEVYNILGMKVTELADGYFPAGYQNLSFDGTVYSSGIYFVRAFVPGKMEQMRKMVMVK